MIAEHAPSNLRRHLVTIVLAVTLLAGPGLLVLLLAKLHERSEIDAGAALRKIYLKVDSRPNWATARDIVAVRANLTESPGAVGSCWPEMGEGIVERYVCWLGYRAASGRMKWVGFTESPFSPSKVQQLTGWHISAMWAGGPYEQVQEQTSMWWLGEIPRADRSKPQSRVVGTECASTALIAGPGTSCAIAWVLSDDLTHSVQRNLSATDLTSALRRVSATDPTTGRRLTFHCRRLSSGVPVECAGTHGAEVYLGASKAPLPFATPAPNQHATL